MLIQFFRVTLVLLILTSFGNAGYAAKLGSEFLVNTFTSSSQIDASVAGLSGGGFVVTWASFQDGSGTGIYGQLYNAAGRPRGSEFRVNTFTASDQGSPSVAALSGGGFVITWASTTQDGSLAGIYGQRYNALGRPKGGEFRVNTFTANNQFGPSVAGLSGGGFMVTWTSTTQDGSSHGIYGQRYSALGRPRSSEFRVNTVAANGQFDASVAGLSGGGFVVTWTSVVQDGSEDGVYGQRYNALGRPKGGEFLVNTFTANHQRNSSVAGLSGGGFVVTWRSFFQDGSGEGIYGQRYNALGRPKGGEFRVNTFTADS